MLDFITIFMPEAIEYNKIISDGDKPNYFKAAVILVCVLVTIVLIYYFIKFYQPKGLIFELNQEVTEREKERLFVDACKDVWDRSEETYIICCEESGKLYHCNDRKTLEPNQFLLVGVALEKVNDLDPYFFCYKSELEGEYMKIGCSPVSYINEPNSLFVSGYVPNQKNFEILELFFYPDGNYSEGELENRAEGAAPDFKLVGHS